MMSVFAMGLLWIIGIGTIAVALYDEIDRRFPK